eukprot:CAMPEP_0181520108 /NCGR_PEP_ID=MMETSP1110-20121109/66135_1 /TAXON_ID=174948 /ORGANISM="Symbiodinium sp., Strain CCMP421" /LENGTH=59 /DNA_ID=CAMNT_0023650577 /DNA_START=87 /DNA_END=263 /DNA_ORIENTATION=-
MKRAERIEDFMDPVSMSKVNEDSGSMGSNDAPYAKGTRRCDMALLRKFAWSSLFGTTMS